MEFHTVTGAFGFSGKYIASLLLREGKNVKTLTNSLNRPCELQGKIKACPLNFNDKPALIQYLQGTKVLYNTYWIRFNSKHFTIKEALKNSLTLIECAKEAGVKRIVHTSITNPSLSSQFEYFKGKARVEEAIKESGLPFSILRPAVLFGREDILINNIAWGLRYMPFFAVFGSGEYKLQPIYAEDFAKLAVKEGSKKDGSVIINAIGPETFTYLNLVKTVRKAIGKKTPILCLPPSFAQFLTKPLNLFLSDQLVTKEEIGALLANCLWVKEGKPTGTVKLSEWVKENSDQLGRRYASELQRRLKRNMPYV